MHDIHNITYKVWDAMCYATAWHSSVEALLKLVIEIADTRRHCVVLSKKCFCYCYQISITI